MSLESSASSWDGISLWFLAIGAALALLGTVAGIQARRLSRRVTLEKAETARREKAAHDEAMEVLRLKIAEANEKAEHERLERLKIEERLAHRVISEEAQDRIAKELAGYATRYPMRPRVTIFRSANESEAVNFTQQVVATFHKARWNVIEPPDSANVVEMGILIGIKPLAHTDFWEQAHAVIEAFSREGIAIRGPFQLDAKGKRYADTSGYVCMIVGLKQQ